MEWEFSPKRDEMAGDSRKVRNEEIHYLYSPPNIGVIESKRKSWTVLVSKNGEEEYIQASSSK
jgi:hypothetical protein